MKQTISKLCKDLEKEKNIKILFAIENGSRAWRMHSKDSDYDVRFVYVRPLEEYIQINKPSDVLYAAYDKDLNKMTSPQNSYIDMAGFDIFKFVKMLSSSNPTVIEWLVTDIIYYGEQNPVLKKFAKEYFSKISLYHHYKSMCRNNYLKYLKSGNEVTYKKYLYSFRGLINAKWIAHHNSGNLPPISFLETLNNSKEFISPEIVEKLNDIINLKSQGKEKDIIQNQVKLDNYIEEFLKDDSEAPKEKSHLTLTVINDELRKIVLYF